MSAKKVWGFCPRCNHTQRFERVAVDHALHGLLTVVTLGLWGISWVALTIGNRMKPWRCRQCGGNEPDFGKERSALHGTPAIESRTGIEPKSEYGVKIVARKD